MATSTRPPPPGLPVKTSALPPNQTLYLRNLPDQIPKEDLKRNLYMLFATHGVILDIITLKTMKMRGQAHVVFRDVDSSTQAMRALHGFNFFGKEMSIAYAKGKSDTIAKLTGTFEVQKELPEKELEQAGALTAGFGAAPAKAVPVNEAERAKGTKRAREEEEEKEAGSDEDDAMEMSESDEE